MTSISLETCIMLTFPLTKSRKDIAMCRVRIMSAVSWLLAGLGAIPQVEMPLLLALF